MNWNLSQNYVITEITCDPVHLMAKRWTAGTYSCAFS
jgi:hypothetical protein